LLLLKAASKLLLVLVLQRSFRYAAPCQVHKAAPGTCPPKGSSGRPVPPHCAATPELVVTRNTTRSPAEPNLSGAYNHITAPVSAVYNQGNS
jgi:hypothetical protein